MGNRGQKRSEMVDELPADKRACNSLEFRPSTSNSSIQTHMNSTPETHDVETHEADMDTSSSSSASNRSEEEELERDSAYGSCDSNDADPRPSSLREYQRQRSSGDHGRLRGALESLTQGTESSVHLTALTELCEVLSFCTEDSLSSMMADSLSPVLVRLARTESNPDVMLLAIRALTYLCDVFPRASAFLVRHDAVPALCQRLMAIEYLDVAEQCLQALEKISRDQPLPCLQAGAIMAVLSFIDFFSTSVQRVALSTVVNICKKLPNECPSSLMEAIPILCNLLQYEDRQLVEHVATCLIKIVERVSRSPEMLDELCKHGLINQATHLIRLNSRTTLSQPIYNGLIGLLVKLSAGSIVAFRTLYELNVSSILKDILASYDLSHGMSSPHVVDGQGNQVHEVLKLLNELLPNVVRDQDVQQHVLDKESFLVDRPNLLHGFGSDILPMLIQVVNSGANLYVCYGCLTVISKLVYFSKSDMLVELLKNANISSFLAGVFARKDHHVLMLSLQITENILQKHSDVFLNSFIKEGVIFAIDALLAPEKCSQLMFPVFSGIQLPFDSQKSASKVELRCLCDAFDTGQSPPASDKGKCKIEKDGVQNLATHIRTSYFAPELCNSEKGLTDILEKLRALSAALNDLIDKSATSAEDEEKFACVLHEIMEKLNGRESVSTFEFIESGIVRSLVNYISDGRYLREKVALDDVCDHHCIIEKRFEVFARLSLYSSNIADELPLSIIVQKLQSALSSLESFPVVLSHASKQRNSFATVPQGRCVSHPCLKVRFVRGEGEASLSEYIEEALTVDPFSSLDAIEGFLLPRVRIKSTENIQSGAQAVDPMESVPFQFPSNANYSQGESSSRIESESIPTDLPEIQEGDASIPQSSPEHVVNQRQKITGETSSSNDKHFVSAEKLVQPPSLADADTKSYHIVSCNDGAALPKLAFYLEGQRLDCTSTLYQAILQQKIKAGQEMNTVAKLWSQVYTLNYRIAAEDNHQECLSPTQNSSLMDEIGTSMQHTSFCSSICNCKVASDLDKLSPTYDILFLLKSLEALNRFAFHLMSQERIHAFARGHIDNLDNLKVVVTSVSQNAFVSSKLTEKLEQQMRDSLVVSIGGLPLWCNELMTSCPFLFSFDAKCKYFRLSAFGYPQVQPQTTSHNNSVVSRDRQQIGSSLPRKKILVCRDQILESAIQMMDLYACAKVPIEVVYNEEVGTGLGPTLEYYTLVSHEFQKFGLGLWREDHNAFTSGKSLHTEHFEIIVSPFGLFPRPWLSTLGTSDEIQFSEVTKKFVLLGQVIAKALQDGRILDLPFSKAFYKLVLQQDLNLYDIHSFDPELGRTLLEFQAIVDRKKNLGSSCGELPSSNFDACFRDARIEDLCLDFTLPGYPDHSLSSHPDCKMVTMDNLEEYVALVVDATIHSGISRQVEAFKSGFNQVFPIKYLQIFTEGELERLLCGECDFWAPNEVLDHIKFDHGYTASSPPITNLLEIIREFDYEQRRAFLQFVTGAPRLPPGGLASLNPKLTIVRKHCSSCADTDLPSVMTCANYLKLPPYSSKDKMKEKLLYAITEGQGSFHLS